MRYPRGRAELGGRAEPGRGSVGVRCPRGRAEPRGMRYPGGRAELEQFKKRREIRNGVKSITISIDSL